MRKRYPQTQQIIQTEEEAICATRQEFGERDWRLAYIVDEMLKLQYFNGKVEPANTVRGFWQVYCVGYYAQAPYTILKTHELWRRAYYLESFVLVRHLLEAFTQVRYFEKHPTGLRDHLTSPKRQDRIPFRTMFDEFAPGGYQLLYGQLSASAHGNLNLMFRAEFSAPVPAGQLASFQPVIGCKYNYTKAEFAYFFLSSVILGFLNYYPTFFPNNTLSDDSEFQDDLVDTKQWLRAHFDHGKNAVKDVSLYEHMEKLISV